MAGKFEGKKTLVKFVTIDMSADVLEKNEAELLIDYTRSKDIAEKAVKKALTLSDDVLVKVTELVNEKSERKEYDPQSVMDFAYHVCEMREVTDNEGIAADKAKATDDDVAIVVTYFTYTAQVMMSDGMDKCFINEYKMDEVNYGSVNKHTAREMRSFIAMNAEQEFTANYGKQFYCVGMHGECRYEFRRVCLVHRDDVNNIKLREIKRRK